MSLQFIGLEFPGLWLGNCSLLAYEAYFSHTSWRWRATRRFFCASGRAHPGLEILLGIRPVWQLGNELVYFSLFLSSKIKGKME